MSARVLVVDDVPANVRLLEARLSAEYFDVLTASNGAQALETCARVECDIILLDVMMPDMDGFEVCRRLKANPATHFIPVVMITALDNPSDRVRGLEAGADDFLTKPVSDVVLTARVRSLTRLKMMTDELRMRAMTSLEIGVQAPEREAVCDSGKGGRVLLVDDRPSSYERLASMLSAEHSVDVEVDPSEALFRAAESNYDLLIVSLGLENFDGLRLCSQARSLERTRHVPILAVADAAFFAVTFLRAIVQVADAHPRRGGASLADQLHVAGRQRHFLREPAALRVFLAPLDVLVHAVDALDDHFAGAAVDPQHLAAGPAVFAGDHSHHVVGFNAH